MAGWIRKFLKLEKVKDASKRRPMLANHMVFRRDVAVSYIGMKKDKKETYTIEKL